MYSTTARTDFCPFLKDIGIGTYLLATSAITASKIAALNITTDKLATDAITATKVANRAISTAQLATDAVTATKVANRAISTAQLATDAVTATKVANRAISTAQLATDAVTATKIANRAINTAQLATNAVTATKLASAELAMGQGNQGSAAGNLNAKYVVGTTAASNTVATFAHGLARQAVGYEVIRCNKDSIIYDDRAFTVTNIYIKSTRQSTIVTMMVW